MIVTICSFSFFVLSWVLLIFPDRRGTFEIAFLAGFGGVAIVGKTADWIKAMACANAHRVNASHPKDQENQETWTKEEILSNFDSFLQDKDEGVEEIELFPGGPRATLVKKVGRLTPKKMRMIADIMRDDANDLNDKKESSQ